MSDYFDYWMKRSYASGRETGWMWGFVFGAGIVAATALVIILLGGDKHP